MSIFAVFQRLFVSVSGDLCSADDDENNSFETDWDWNKKNGVISYTIVTKIIVLGVTFFQLKKKLFYNNPRKRCSSTTSPNFHYRLTTILVINQLILKKSSKKPPNYCWLFLYIHNPNSSRLIFYEPYVGFLWNNLLWFIRDKLDKLLK